jgi:hypothetical protein
MSKGPNDRSGVFFEGGFNVFGGDDTFWNNVTANGVSALRFERSGDTTFHIQNYGQLLLKSVTGATGAALEVNALASQDFLKITDHENSDHILTVRKLTSGTGWITDLKTRDSGAPSNDDVALRITHDVQSNSPPQGADLLSAGYTNATEVYQELFTMKQSGDFYLQGGSGADLLWGTDGAGNIGGAGGNRPDNMYAASTVNANGSVLKTGAVDLGPAGATDKTLTALQASTSPYIKYVNGSSKWQFSNDGTTPLDFGTSNVGTWDDLYDLDKVLTVDGAPLEFNQTSTTGIGFHVHRNTSSAASPLMQIETDNTGDGQPALLLDTAGGTAAKILQAGGALSNTTFEIEDASSGFGNLSVYLHDGTDTHFYISPDGDSYIYSDSALATALHVERDSAAEGDVFTARDANGSRDRFNVTSYGVTTITGTAYSASNTALTVLAEDQAAEGDCFIMQLGDYNGGSPDLHWTFRRDGSALCQAPITTQLSLSTFLPSTPAKTGSDQMLTAKYTSPTAAGSTGGTISVFSADIDDSSFDTSDFVAFDATKSSANAGAGTLYGFRAATNRYTYSFYGASKIGISPSATATDPFLEFDGTRATGTGGNINTDSTSGETLRVLVDDGASGFNTRWIPAFTDPDMDAFTPSWNAIYANDPNSNVLTVSNEDDPFEINQTTNDGYAFYVHRNQSTCDAPLVFLYTDHGSDGQPTLHVKHDENGSGTAPKVLLVDASFYPERFWVDSLGDAVFTSSGTGASGTRGVRLKGNSRLYTNNIYNESSNSLFLSSGNHTLQLGYNGGTAMRLTGTLLQSDCDRFTFTGTSGTCNLTSANEFGVTASNVLTLQSTGNDVRIVANRDVEATSGAGYDVSLTATDNASSDILFTAHGSGAIPFNTTSPNNTLNTSAQNIVGAINELDTAVGNVTLDEAYNNDGGAAAVTVDAGSVTWNLSGGNKFEVTLPVSAGDSSLFDVTSTTAASSAHSVTNVTSDLIAGTSATGDLTAYAASLGGTTTGTTYAYRCADSDFTYGLYSAAPGYIARTGLTGADDGLSIVATSAGLGGVGNTVNLIDLSFTENASDNDSVNGIDISLTPDASATNSTRAIAVDLNWDRGLYSSSPIEAYYTHTSAVSGLSVFAASYITTRSIVTGQSSASPMGLHVDLEGNSSDTGGSLIALHVDADDGSGDATCYGLFTATGSSLDYAIFANSKSYFTEVLNANGGPTYATKVVGNTSSQTGFTSSGLYVEHSDGGTGGGFFDGITMEGDSTAGASTSTAINVDNEWDLGIACASWGSRFYFTFPATSVSTTPVLRVDATTPGTAMGSASNIYAVKTTVNANSVDPGNTDYYGLHSEFDADSTTSTNCYGLYLSSYGHYYAGKIGKAIYSDSGVSLFSHIQSNGFGGNAHSFMKVQVQSSGTGLEALDSIDCFRARVVADADDSGDWYGFHAEGPVATITGGSTPNGFYADSNWFWGLYSASKAYITAVDPGDYASLLVYATASTVLGAGEKRVSVYSETNGHASDPSTADMISFFANSDATGSATRYGVLAESSLDYGVYADECHIEINGPYDSAKIPFSTKGYIDVNTFSDGLTESTRYGIRVDHTRSTSSTGTNYIHNFHADCSAVDVNELVTGFHAGNISGTSTLDSGFWAQEIGTGAIQVTEGQFSNVTHTGDYTHTTNSTALVRSQTESDGISGDGWRTFDGTYVRHTSDTGAGRWYGFLAGVSGSVGSAITTGFRAQSTLDTGVDSLAGFNRFWRQDDNTTSTDPVVDIDNQDNDSSGGTAAALRASNTYSSTSSKVIEIVSAYSSTTEGSRRAIVFQTAKQNRRTLNLAHAISDGWGGASPDFQWVGWGTNGYFQSRSSGATGIYVTMPIHLPHRATIKKFYLRAYGGGGTATGTQLPYGQLMYGTRDSSSYTVNVNQTYATGTGTVTITSPTLSHQINNEFELVLRYRNVSTGASGYSYVYGVQIDYEIDDLGAAPGF